MELEIFLRYTQAINDNANLVHNDTVIIKPGTYAPGPESAVNCTEEKILL